MGLESGISLLVVGSEAGMLHLLSDVLMGFGFEVTALHADDAVIDAVELLEPMAIIYDELEEESGGECLYEELKRHGLSEEIAFIILSDSLDSGRIAHCLNAGVEEFISKPFAIDELHARIRKAVRHHCHEELPAADSEGGCLSGLCGDLGVMDLPDLVLNLNQNLRSGVLYVEVAEGTYRFDFSKGELVQAVGPDRIVGRKAFFRAIRSVAGSFRFVAGAETSESLSAAEFVGAGHLLLAAVQEADEYALVRKDLQDGLLSLTRVGMTQKEALPGVLLPLLDEPGRVMSVTALINASPRTDLEVVLELLECMKKQEVVVGYHTESSQSA